MWVSVNWELVTLATWELTTIVYHIRGQRMPQVTFTQVDTLCSNAVLELRFSVPKFFKGTSSQQPDRWLTNYPCMPLSLISWLSVYEFKPFRNITILYSKHMLYFWDLKFGDVYFLVPPYHHLSLPERDAVVSSTVSSPLKFRETVQNKLCLLSPIGLQRLLMVWWHPESW